MGGFEAGRCEGEETGLQSKCREWAELEDRPRRPGLLTGHSVESATETALCLGLGSVRPPWRSKGCEQEEELGLSVASKGAWLPREAGFPTEASQAPAENGVGPCWAVDWLWQSRRVEAGQAKNSFGNIHAGLTSQLCPEEQAVGWQGARVSLHLLRHASPEGRGSCIMWPTSLLSGSFAQPLGPAHRTPRGHIR